MTNENTLNDRAIKLFGVPLLGIIIPNITGLITNNRYTFTELLACYAYFVLVSFIIWQGNVWLMYYVRKKFKPKYNKYYKIISILFSANILYSGATSTLLLIGWKLLSKETYESWSPVVNSTLVIIISSMFITSLYENIFLNRERVNNLSTVEQLNIAKAQAELEALKNQID